jgi:D-beta-D-heptose 7-phosphate kinase/D-beta-D-heptose 1-phosphate adenosyltransferase
MNIQIPAFETVNALIVGDVMLDRYWSGDTSRVSPEAPIPIVHVRHTEERPGGAANVALNVVALGCEATLLGMIGNDEAGDTLEKMLVARGINCLLQRTKIAPTTTKLRLLSRNQQLIRIDFEEEPITFSPERQLEIFKQHLAHVNVVIMSDYRKGALKNAVELIAAARARNIPVLIDPKQHTFAAYRGATMLTPNMKEFQAVVGTVNSLEEIEQKAKQQIIDNDLGAILITRSEEGMSLVTRDEPMLNIPTQAKEVFDVTGAGDTVIATLACAIATGQSWPRAIALANLAAGISISKVGAATVSVPELRRQLSYEHLSGGNVVNLPQLKILVEDAKAHGEKVVFTNGCFDILHAGHVAYLEEAKNLGQRLIVAVNSDESVAQLKGPHRPINTLEQRMAVLAGLSAVDWVIPFTEETPENLICELLPDILVKGGDYKVEDIAGHKCVLNNGGDVKILCFKEGLSTSSVIKKIRDEETT